jgi:DNA-binding NarL/FixJ family response regulator
VPRVDHAVAVRDRLVRTAAAAVVCSSRVAEASVGLAIRLCPPVYFLRSVPPPHLIDAGKWVAAGARIQPIEGGARAFSRSVSRSLAAAYSLGALSTQEIEPEALVSYSRPDRSAIYAITGVRVTR